MMMMIVMIGKENSTFEIYLNTVWPGLFFCLKWLGLGLVRAINKNRKTEPYHTLLLVLQVKCNEPLEFISLVNA